MTKEFTFSIDHTIEAETEEKARRELQNHLDSGVLSGNLSSNWLVRKEDDDFPYRTYLEIARFAIACLGQELCDELDIPDEEFIELRDKLQERLDDQPDILLDKWHSEVNED